jgi:hypothetical protein
MEDVLSNVPIFAHPSGARSWLYAGHRELVVYIKRPQYPQLQVGSNALGA